MKTTSASTLTLVSVEQRLNQLAATMQFLAADVAKLRHADSPSEPHNSQQEVILPLLADGVIVKPSPEMLAIETEWNAVPEEEKRALDETPRNLVLDPPASEMVHRMRSGWYPDESEWEESEESVTITWIPTPKSLRSDSIGSRTACRKATSTSR